MKDKIDKFLKKGILFSSSKFTVKRITGKINFDKDIKILQLGFGKGVFTKEISKHLNKNSHLAIFEIDKDSKNFFTYNSENIKYIEDSAENVSNYYEDNYFDYVISTIPFTTLPNEVGKKIQEQIYKHLKNNGKFMQYQYSLYSYKDFQKLFNQKPKIEFEILNVLPAFIYEVDKSKN